MGATRSTHALVKKTRARGGTGYPAVVTSERIHRGEHGGDKEGLTGTAIPVEEVAQRFQGGDSIDTLAREFGVATDLVSEALRVKILEAA